ncbi:Serine/threonine-protein phosphatase 2A 56 kDa regulatory subunit delta 1 isoform [Tritrichomonas foetus]|uniref:Serine/threonine-protein phosphatase 2A 56 kDa regulatory subunit delta 1 isoform n=1 Tax=Tritrichomonas foetus TaxID=1144522 RepID=A0A1J4KW55_9EUKA|nr:Serine/threonine-protein phosphatase 2A 56 kDa regulatory subunit delta 1 isoform [Tritrichomonas foetus]|eukprot:OHT13988.1 Serine/threonine-protein phosphatase 2A 56 kDa regulatory subunit delta 1 isoform [Tritrichomonas foetus]
MSGFPAAPGGRTVGRRVIQANPNRQMLAPKLGKAPLSANPRVIERSNLILKNRQKLCTPRSDMLQTMGIQKLITSTYVQNEEGNMVELPDLKDTQPNQYNEIMRKKLKECCKPCDFGSPTADSQNKATKSKYLTEVLEHIKTSRYFQLCDTQTFDVLFEMITKNIFRTLPPIPPLSRVPMIGDDIKDTLLEATWPHLDIIYHIFLEFLGSPQMVVAQHIKRFDNAFLSNFFALFDSTDPRERESMKMVLHRLYMKFNQLRPKMRQIMQQIFFSFLYDRTSFSGINELLEFYISIINGFTVPIKPDNLKFLFNILIPLHGSDYFHLFQENLFYCILQYIEKDPSLIPKIIHEIIKYWPNSSFKGLLFLAEISALIDSMSEDQFKIVMVEVFHLVARCIESPNFQISETAILLWKSDNFVLYVAQYAGTIFPLIIPALYRAGKNHWNNGIKNIAISVLRICMQIAPELYDQVYRGLDEIEAILNKKTEQEKGAWIELKGLANDVDPELEFTNFPNTVENVFKR